MDEKQKPLGTKPGTKSGFEAREEFSSFFHSAVRELDVEESKFDIIAEKLFHLFICDFGGFYFYFPKLSPRLSDYKFEVHYRRYKAGGYSTFQIADIEGCCADTVRRKFRRISNLERLRESERMDARSPEEKKRLLDGGIGTGKSEIQMRRLADFFHKAVRQLDIEESKFDTIAKKLLHFLLLNFGGQFFYIPMLKINERDEHWKDCFTKYRRGTYSVEKIAKLMQVSHRSVYRRLKKMAEQERQARRQADAAAPPAFHRK